MSFDYSSLVTDRSEADVSGRTGKGAYNAEDINRVTSAMEDIHARLTGYGYITGYQAVNITHRDGTTDTVWREDDEPQWSQLERYRTNVAALRDTLAAMGTTPQTPESMAALTWAKANDIEKILADTDTMLRNMAAAWYYSGDLFAGEI